MAYRTERMPGIRWCLERSLRLRVDIVEFTDDSKLVTALAGALLEEEPMRARLTYRFAPVDGGTESSGKAPRYRGAVYGGDNFEKSIATELRSYLHLLFLHALRDVESDIRNWRRSPLRALLQGAATAAAEEDLDAVRRAMKEANSKLNDLGVVKDLGGSIGSRLVEMVGPARLSAPSWLWRPMTRCG